MSSKSYWQKRETENKKKNQKSEAQYAKEIQEIYDSTMDRVQKEINGYYAKYAKAEKISMAEAKKRVAQLDIEEYQRKAKRYVKNRTFTNEANDEMRLYNATMKINRLEMLKANIGLEMVDGFNDLQQFFEEKLTERTLEEFERQAGILGKTIIDNAEAAHSIVNASFKNATFSDRIWMYQDMLKTELDSLLREGLIQGKNPNELARHLKKKFGVNQFQAERLMRTELARVQVDAQKQSFERNGFEEYTYIACGGSDCCDVCRALDGKHFKVKDMMPGENAPPMHPGCHCSAAAYEDSEEYEKWLDFLDKGGTTEEWRKLGGEREESKPNYKYENTVVDLNYIKSHEYRRKITQLVEDTYESRSIFSVAKDILAHRSGTKYEDLSYIATTKNRIITNKDYNVEKKAKPNKPMNELITSAPPYTVIGVHNHPESFVPSIADIQCAHQRKYRYGIVVCHNGIIYKYTINPEKINILNAGFALDRMEKKGYTEEVKKLFKDAGVEMEVL